MPSYWNSSGSSNPHKSQAPAFRNVVELIFKLQELRFIDFDLLHTVSGKEYITTEQLQFEKVAEIRKSGRVSLIDLSDVLGVDLYHIEKQGQLVVASDPELIAEITFVFPTTPFAPFSF